MDIRTLALILSAAAIGAGCASKETKPEPAPPPPPVVEAPPAKPTCPPVTSAKIKSTKKKGQKETVAPVDCEPAKPKTTPTAAPTPAPAPAATAPVAAAPAPAPAKEAAKPAEAGKPRMMKSTDGTFEGEVYGNIPPNSKWAKLQIGMMQAEVERILGGTSMDIRTHPTGKAFIPFYFGTDRYRYEVVYRGQGSVSYTGGSWGGGQGVLMMINYDPNI
jgi:hypothetical protein